MRHTNRGTAFLTIAIYLGSVVGIFSQPSDGLDFLDKVENIKIPAETETKKSLEPVSKPTTSTPTLKPTASTKPAKTTVKPKPTRTTTTVKPTNITPSSPTSVPTTTDTPAPVSPKLTSTSTSTNTGSTKSSITSKPLDPTLTGSNLSTNINPEEDSMKTTPSGTQVWIDDKLEMEPDYLPGFDLAVKIPDEKPQDEPKYTKETSRPLPTLDGNYSIWNSFTEFLSTYQKAFYIFGILILFAIYRLKSGRSNSSSRKSTPTVRRMRR